MHRPLGRVVVAARVMLARLAEWRRPPSRGGRALAAIIAALVAAAPAPGVAEEPLSFFKNYFATGDYTVRGVSLWRGGDSSSGKAAGRIPPLGGAGGVPRQADLLAAFLYVQTAESVEGSGIDHATFNKIDLGPFTAEGGEPGSGTFAKPLVPWSSAPAPCWDATFPGGRKLRTYRADVLRFLPIDPNTGKHDLNIEHWITVPDAGRALADVAEGGKETKWSSAPRALGASLVVVYRDPAKPFASIVVYDGAYRKPATATMTQTILGFYQASQLDPAAKMSHIVGDGNPSLGEQVLLNGTLVSTNPYAAAAGPKWDNPTLQSLPLTPGASSATITVSPFGKGSDCVTFSAIVFKTAVQDTDGDALVDAWETTTDLKDPNGLSLPDLKAMGANPQRKDLFVEIDYMYAAQGTTYGGVAKPAHSHLPEREALGKVAAAFDEKQITVHFDVGAAYQNPPASYIIPAEFARGGQGISETRACFNPKYLENAAEPMMIECAPGSDGKIVMPGQYPAHPGTVGWKTGFQFLRDVVLGMDRNRKDLFHYVLFAHSLGIPKEDCLNDDGSPDLACQQGNADFHVPRTNSGIADLAGGDVLVTLGAFENTEKLPIGTTFMQGSTLMHELGHNFELTHAGLQSLDPAVPREPNCKPLYLSVMNYLYQLRGLPDADGKIQLDYSSDVTGSLNELVSEDAAVTGPYRIGWYAPWEGSYVAQVAKPAGKHCNGSELMPGEAAMVRVDAPGVALPVDWDADGLADTSPGYELDINFSGYWDFPPSPVVPTRSDWASLRFSQLGGRRSPGGFYVDAQNSIRLGPLSLDVGRGDIGRGDIGRGDIGRGDIGRGDIGDAIGRGDIGRGDIGRGDIGRGDIGRGDIGRGDIGRGDIGRGVFGLGDLDLGGIQEPLFELDLPTALAVSGNAPTPPSELSACLTITDPQAGIVCADGGDRPVLLTWTVPGFGHPISYSIYRFVVDAGVNRFPPATLPTEPIAVVSPAEPLWNRTEPPTAFVDASAPGGASVAYFVVANFFDASSGIASSTGISNFATVVTPALSWYAPSVPISPINSAVIQQTAPASCPAAWYGFQIVFEWEAPTPAPPDGYSYEIISQVNGASNAAVHVFAPGPQRTHTVTECNAYVPDANLTGWTWQIRAVDGAFQPVSDWSPAAQYQFAPCVLADGTPCGFTPPQPTYTWQLVSDTVCNTYNLVSSGAPTNGPFTCDATSVGKTILNVFASSPVPTNPTDGTNFLGWNDLWRDATGLWDVNGFVEQVPCTTPGQGRVYVCTAPPPLN
jgi:hypothetical protein